MKHLDTAMAPWLEGSEFAILDASLIRWHETLPGSLHLNSTSTYIHAETGEFGALCLLHGAYHITSLDLYRIFVPVLYKVRSACNFPPEQSAFLAKRRGLMFGHAKALAIVVNQAMSTDGARTYADFWWPNLAFDSSRNLVYYVCHVLDQRQRTEAVKAEVKSLLRSNIKALKLMKSINALAEPLSLAAERILAKFSDGSSEDAVHDHEIDRCDDLLLTMYCIC